MLWFHPFAFSGKERNTKMTLKRRLLTATLATTASLGLLLAVGVPAAQADDPAITDGTCPIIVHVPAKIVINKNPTVAHATYGNPYGCSIDAITIPLVRDAGGDTIINLKSSSTPNQVDFAFDPTYAILGKAHTKAPFGSYTYFNDATQRYGVGEFSLANGVEHTTIKYSSHTNFKTAKRSGGKVTLTYQDTHFRLDKTGTSKYRLWAGAKVSFQKKVNGTWKTVKTVTTSSHGYAKATITSGKAQWRAITATTGTVWNSTGKTVTK
jgi:hypothetical protein